MNSARLSVAAFLVFELACSRAFGEAPVKPPVPGLINPAVTQENINQTICLRGWTSTVRPPASYTGAIKRALLRGYGIPRSQSKLYELDHLVPLEAGGNPADPNNLWLELWDGALGARAKDRIENRIHRQICRGAISLQDGQRIFLSGQWMGMTK